MSIEDYEPWIRKLVESAAPLKARLEEDGVSREDAKKRIAEIFKETLRASHSDLPAHEAARQIRRKAALVGRPALKLLFAEQEAGDAED